MPLHRLPVLKQERTHSSVTFLLGFGFTLNAQRGRVRYSLHPAQATNMRAGYQHFPRGFDVDTSLRRCQGDQPNAVVRPVDRRAHISRKVAGTGQARSSGAGSAGGLGRNLCSSRSGPIALPSRDLETETPRAPWPHKPVHIRLLGRGTSPRIRQLQAGALSHRLYCRHGDSSAGKGSRGSQTPQDLPPKGTNGGQIIAIPSLLSVSPLVFIRSLCVVDRRPNTVLSDVICGGHHAQELDGYRRDPQPQGNASCLSIAGTSPGQQLGRAVARSPKLPVASSATAVARSPQARHQAEKAKPVNIRAFVSRLARPRLPLGR